MVVGIVTSGTRVAGAANRPGYEENGKEAINIHFLSACAKEQQRLPVAVGQELLVLVLYEE